jgi:hypothetical protein
MALSLFGSGVRIILMNAHSDAPWRSRLSSDAHSEVLTDAPIAHVSHRLTRHLVILQGKCLLWPFGNPI